MRYNPSRFLGVVVATALGLSTASAAQIFFNGSGTGDMVYFSWNIPNTIFGFFDGYFDANTACPSCFSASTLGFSEVNSHDRCCGEDKAAKGKLLACRHVVNNSPQEKSYR